MPMEGGSMYGHKGMSGAGYYGEGGKSGAGMPPVAKPTPMKDGKMLNTGGYKAPNTSRNHPY